MKGTKTREALPRAVQELLPLLQPETLPAEEEARLRAQLDADPDLAAHFARLERSWQALELPTPAEAPAGFAHRVAAEARSRLEGEMSWSAAPVWARAAAAAALLLGTVGGVSLGLLDGGGPLEEGLGEQVTLADDYWLLFEEDVEPEELQR